MPQLGIIFFPLPLSTNETDSIHHQILLHRDALDILSPLRQVTVGQYSSRLYLPHRTCNQNPKGYKMNTRPVIDDAAGPQSLSAAFNHDASCFSVGLDTGYCVFNSDPCELRASRDFNAGISIAQMLGRFNFLALVGGGRRPKYPQNQVVIWDDARQRAVIILSFTTAVLRVRLSRSHIIVVLQNGVHIYAFASPPAKLSEFETAANPLGLCCLGSSLLAFPGRSHGQIQLVELETGNVSIIPAHSTPLRALELSSDGRLLATASEQGTLVRVFSTSNCVRIAELRRGVDPAFIFSISISPSSSILAVTSDKSTLHVFDLPPQPSASLPHQPLHWPATKGNGSSVDSAADESSGSNQKWGFLSRLPLLPRVFSDIYSFASAHFEIGDEYASNSGGGGRNDSPNYSPALGTLGARPQKGVIGWLDDRTVLVIGAGKDGRWERFKISEDGEGKRLLRRDGWKRYLGG
jgi:WD repeat-containing protein 45